jgi:hypothetical protein
LAHNVGKKIFKIVGWILLGLGLLVLIILLFIRSPFGQHIIVNKATQYLAEKTNSKVSIDKLYLTFRGNFYLEGLYLEQPNGDTLVYSNKLETGLELVPYLSSNKIIVSRLEWEGLKAKIARDSTGDFNFNYLMKAFVSQGTSADTTDADTLSSTESSYPEINIGPVNLSDWNLQFTDKLMGLEGTLKLGKLSLAINRMDLNKMEFHVTEILWQNSALSYQQFKPLPVGEDSSESDMPMPLVVLDKLSLKNIKADYLSLPDGMKVQADLGDFLLEMPEANLDKQKVLIKRFSLQDSKIDYQSETIAEAGKRTVEEDTVAPFAWPEWEVELSSIDFSNNQLNYAVDGVRGKAGEFNPEDVAVKDFNLQANNLYYKPKKAGFSLEKLGFTERSGFKLDNFQARLVLNDSSLQINELSVNTGHSGLAGDLDLKYPSLAVVMDKPEKASMELAIQNVKLGVEDAYFFAPSLENNPYLKTFEKKSFKASLLASGNLNRLRLEEIAAQWGRSTSMDISGYLSNPLDTELLSWNLNTFNFVSTAADLNLFTPEDSLGIKYPQNLDLSVASAGSLDDFNLKAMLKAYNASVALTADLSTAQENYNFDLKSTISAVPLGKVMGDTLTYGPLDLELAAQGKVGSLDSLDLSLDSKVVNLVYNGHNYKGLQLTSEISDGEGQFQVIHKDKMLDLNLLADVSLTPSNYNVDMDLELNGADLYGLNFSGKRLRTQFSFNAVFEGKPENFELQSKLTDGTIVLDDQAYPMGGMELALRVLPDSTDFSIQSNVLNGFLQSNVSPGETYKGLSRHFNGYFLDSASLSREQVSRLVNVEMDFTIPSTLLLQRVILPGLKEMEEGSIKMTFNEKESKLDGRVNFPYLSYSGAVLDSLDLNVLSDSANFDFDFGVMALSFGRLAIGPTYFSGEVLENQLYVNFNALHEEEVLANIDFDLGFGKDSMRLHVNPEGMIFNKSIWEVSDKNAFLLTEKKVSFEDFKFSRGEQLVAFGNDPGENSFDLNFNDFRLKTFTSLLNPEEVLAEGLVNGVIKIENPFGATGLQADLSVQDMALLKVPLGNLTLEASGNDQKNYDFDLRIKDKGVDLDLTGGFVADPLGARLNLALDLNKFELDMLEGLTAGAINDGNGFISGKFKVEGSSSDPIYSGNMSFNETEFTVSTLNARFAIDQNKIRVDSQGVYLNQLTIKDDQDNDFVLDGDIITENDFINPQFDLSLTADNFKVLNSTQEDNDLFYGDALIGADVTIKGDLSLPIVDAEISVDKGTNLSVVIPESQLDVVERQGVVTFVNRENPEDILTKRLEETSNSGYTGYKVEMLLNVSPEAVFNLVIDERSGDNLMVEGAADLQLNMDPNGRVTLTGIYELSEGHYELSLYNLVSKRFEIQEGSTISWAGDPMDANMDITAIYSVKTSASDLMTATASGGSRETMSKYRQEFTFVVYLNIDGALLKPEISFTMDMPEDERGALGGSVYAQVKQLNNQEGELNRQVFSLLVLNSFFPSGDNSGGGGTTAMARSSVSQLLSGQLNTFTNNLVGGTGLELDVGLDSFEDYQGDSPQSRTQLNVNASKRFLDDRLIVQVGSQIDIEGSSSTGAGNSLLGNVSVEYLITENGRYRARGFRKNQFESFIDGQLVVTGLSVIFNREFNKFEDLWRGIDSKRKEQENQAE